ncbi:hypothetical protein [Croceiramulus getboli]|nr:hypothetical protein P8624_10350 [Flavobacteriaceae bacterium YJPT1-3]
MGGEGSMMAANQSLKNNRGMMRRKNRSPISLVTTSQEQFTDHKQATPEQLAKIRERLQADRRERNRSILLLTGLFFLIAGGFLIYFLS